MSDFETSAAQPSVEDAEREKSPRRGMASAVIGLEAIVLGLTTPVMLNLSNVSHAQALWIGLSLCVACIVVAGILRFEWAYYLGYAVQIAAIVLGVVIPLMFVLGGIFALLWVMADQLGRKIDRERAAAWAAFDRVNASSQ